jgi:hypothetical protein
MDSNRRKLTLLILLLGSVPGVARADNLGGLIYLLVIWPVGGLLCISLIVLGILAAVKLKKKATEGTRTFGKWVAGTAIAEAAIYPFVVAGLDAGWDARAGGVMFFSMLPVLVLSAVCVVLGFVLIRRR